jgi:hypothetical protein
MEVYILSSCPNFRRFQKVKSNKKNQQNLIFIVFLLCCFRLKVSRKVKKSNRKQIVVYYQKNVNKETVVKLWNMEQVFDFIQKHLLRMTVDLFSFNSKIDCQTTLQRNKWWRKCMVEVST